jgi:hypothetical protein
VDLNKLLSILSEEFVEEVRNDYFIIIPRRINGFRKTNTIFYCMRSQSSNLYKGLLSPFAMWIGTQ